MPYDDLHCSFDKVSRCVELGIDVLVDDSPVNLIKAQEGGNRRRDADPPVERGARAPRGDAIGAPSWHELRAKLDPVLA